MFPLISMGKLLMDYENMSNLFHFLDVKDFLKFHSSSIIGWGMATCMHELVLGFHPFTSNGKLAVNAFVVILISTC